MITIRCIDSETGKMAVVPQGCTSLLTFSLRDYDRLKTVGQSQIDTATMTLIDHDSGGIIGEQEDIDVKNCFDSNGTFKKIVSANYNNIISSSERITEELHIAKITVKATGEDGAIVETREFHFMVGNQIHVPNMT